MMILGYLGPMSVARKLGFSGESPYRFLAYQKRDGRLPRA